MIAMKTKIATYNKFPPRQIEAGQILLTYIDRTCQRVRIAGRNSKHCFIFPIDIGGEMMFLPTAEILDCDTDYRNLPATACHFSLYGLVHLMRYKLPTPDKLIKQYLANKSIAAEIQSKQCDHNGAIEIIAHDITGKVNINAVMLKEIYACEQKPKVDWSRTKTMEISNVDDSGDIFGRFEDASLMHANTMPWMIFDLTADDGELVKVMADRMRGEELVSTNAIRMNLIDLPNLSPNLVAIARSKLRQSAVVSVRFVGFDPSSRLMVQIFLRKKNQHTLNSLNDSIQKVM